MKRYIPPHTTTSESDAYRIENQDSDRADFYQRWYAKFGTPQPHTMSKDKFMARLKEMKDFE